MNTAATDAHTRLLASLTVHQDAHSTQYRGEHRGADGSTIGVCIWISDGGRVEITHATHRGIDWTIHLDGSTPTAVIGATLNAALATIPPTPDHPTSEREPTDS